MIDTTNTAPYCVIIGGTSGIGLALATWHLSQGWKVLIVGSNDDKIAKINSDKSHKHLTVIKCDLKNHDDREALLFILNKDTIHRVIYSAGFYYNERRQHLSPQESEKLLAINLQAFHELFFYISEQLKKQKIHAQMIAISSVAGLLDFSQSSLYAKCKKSMIDTCQAYRMALAPFDIDVICIASGYVDTARLRELNGGSAKHKPFLISENTAVMEILYAIDTNIALHIFPKPMKYLINTLSLLPKPLLSRVMALQYRHQDRF